MLRRSSIGRSQQQSQKELSKSVSFLILLTLLTAGCATATPGPAGLAVSPEQRLAAGAVESCAASFAAADEFSGVVMLAQNGRALASAAYGYADPETRRKNTAETPFNIASLGKIFTATAIGQLIERGKLRLDDGIGRHLPELPPELGRITVRQLLNHSSGLGEIFSPANQQRIASAETSRELLPLIVTRPLQFEPGSRHGYSNTGPIVLGALIEALTGTSFPQYVRDNIFAPAGMESSTIRGRPTGAAAMLTRSEVLTGEMRITSGEQLPRRPSLVVGGGPYGGGYSSAHDLLRFADAVRSNRLLREETQELLWSGLADVPGAGPGRYAHGFQVSGEGLNRTVGHSGLAGGANAEFHWAPHAGWTLVVLSNFDPMAATIIGNAARLMLTGEVEPSAACEAARRGRGMPEPIPGANRDVPRGG